jgi:hypothetical protein
MKKSGLAALLEKSDDTRRSYFFFFAAAFLAGAFFAAAFLGLVARPPHPQPAIHLTSQLAFKYNYSLSYLNFLL